MLKRLKSVSMLLFLMGASTGAAYAVANPGVTDVKITQQSGTCTGIVKDATGETVIGASVVVKGTTNGTITGLDGDFSLSNVKKGDIIVISFVGYQTQEVKWTGQPIDVTLKDDTALEDFEKLKSVIKDFGANTVMTTPQEHDKAVALISHAPMLVAQALCKNIESNELAQQLASSGFRDTTRLALSNTEMANDMILMNGENIKDVVTLLDKNIDAILESDYKKQAEHIKEFRQNLYVTKV